MTTQREAAEAELIEIVSKEFNKQRRAIIDEIQSEIPVMDEMFWEERRISMETAMLPLMLDIYDRTMDAVMRQLSLKQNVFDEFPARAFRWARGFTKEVVRGVTQTTRRAVGAAVSTLVSTPGMTIRDLGDMLSNTFGPSRAQTIAVTETTRAIFEVGAEGAASMPLKRIGFWTTIMDDRVCPICAPLDGVRETASGSRQWINPDDGQVYRPPAHPNCRCMIVYEFL